MKKFMLIILLASCHQKAVPVISERKAEPPKKFESIYPPKETVPPDTTAGKQLFTARCGRCHGLPETNQFTAEKWDGILPVMFPRTGMNNEEALHVRAYVFANAKK
jgi:hypothetical protein